MSIHSSVLVEQSQAAGVIYTADGALRGNAITTIYLCNRDSVQHSVNLYIVPPGFQANSNNIVYYNLTIGAGDTFMTDTAEKLVLQNGATICANASLGDSIVATVSAIGIS